MTKAYPMPPEPWVLESISHTGGSQCFTHGPLPKPTRVVVDECTDDGEPISYRTLSDDELEAWEREYNANPNRNGGVVVINGPGVVHAVFTCPGARVEAMLVDGEWHRTRVESDGSCPFTANFEWVKS